jgi:hypothetical protein
MGTGLVGLPQGHFSREEARRTPEHHALETRGVVDQGKGGHVGLLPLVDGDCVLQRLAALPTLDDPRVARVCQRAGAEIGADEDSVLVQPVDLALGLGQREAAVHELASGQVELAHHSRVGAAARGGDEATGRSAAQATGSRPDPVFGLGLGQGVEIQHQFPGRLGLAVLGQRGAPPRAVPASRQKL